MNFKDLRVRSITSFFFGLLVISSYFFLHPLFFSILLAIAGVIMVHEWWQLTTNMPTLKYIAVLYPITPTLLLIALNQQPIYRPLLVYLFGIIWSFDIGCYIAGSLIGYHKVAPSVSPGKSWEGFAGGLLITIGLLYACTNAPFMVTSMIAFATCAIGFAGDLFESYIKRLAHVKDSSSLLPGHGGLLDRLDSVLFVAVFFYLLKDQLTFIFST